MPRIEIIEQSAVLCKFITEGNIEEVKKMVEKKK